MAATNAPRGFARFLWFNVLKNSVLSLMDLIKMVSSSSISYVTLQTQKLSFWHIFVKSRDKFVLSQIELSELSSSNFNGAVKSVSKSTSMAKKIVMAGLKHVAIRNSSVPRTSCSEENGFASTSNSKKNRRIGSASPAIPPMRKPLSKCCIFFKMELM